MGTPQLTHGFQPLLAAARRASSSPSREAVVNSSMRLESRYRHMMRNVEPTFVWPENWWRNSVWWRGNTSGLWRQQPTATLPCPHKPHLQTTFRKMCGHEDTNDDMELGVCAWPSRCSVAPQHGCERKHNRRGEVQQEHPNSTGHLPRRGFISKLAVAKIEEPKTWGQAKKVASARRQV